MKEYWYKLIIIMTLLLIIIGCDDSLIIKDFVVESETYQESGYFLGNSKIKFRVEVLGQKKRDIIYNWVANGGRFLSKSGREVEYITSKKPGDYSITLFVRDEQGNKVEYNFPFSVKGNYPQNVVLKKVVNYSVKEGVVLDWSKYVGDDFYGYKIIRSNNVYIDDTAQVIAEINFRDNSSYVDMEIEPGKTYTYQIMVINNQGYLSISNERMVTVWSRGVKEVKLGSNLTSLKIDSIRNKVYLFDQTEKDILVLDIKSNKIVRRIDVGFSIKKMILLDDNSCLCLFPEDGNLIIKVDLDKFKQYKYRFKYKIKDVEAGSRYAYLNIGEGNDLLVFDLIKGVVNKRSKVKEGDKVVIGDKLKLLGDKYLFVDKSFGNGLIYHLNDLSKPIVKISVGAVDKIISYQSVNDYYLYLSNEKPGQVQIFKFSPDDQAKLVFSFNVEDYLEDFVLDKEGDWVFIVCKKDIYLFSTKDYMLKKRIELKNYIYDIDINNKTRKLYLLTSTNNLQEDNLLIVDLNQILDIN